MSELVSQRLPGKAVMTAGQVNAAVPGVPEPDVLFRRVIEDSRDDALSALFSVHGVRIVHCERADEGMGASLACGVAASADANGWVVALADMPWIATRTIRAVGEAIVAGASLAAPVCRGERGHPVGFAASHRAALMALEGDEGARAILAHAGTALVRIDVDDAGVLRDVDAPGDLTR